jgi:hypothetical protein
MHASNLLKTPDDQFSVNMLITTLQTGVRGGGEDTFLPSLKHNSQQTVTHRAVRVLTFQKDAALFSATAYGTWRRSFA